MTETLFYHLERRALEDVLPGLVEKSLQRAYAEGDMTTPFGGYKASGIGRQNGITGFDQYTDVTSVAYPAR